jgi:hypothetical protein
MHQNNIFFIFLKLFLKSAYQNDLKHIKKLIFNKKIKFLKNIIYTAFPNILFVVTNPWIFVLVI